MSTVSAASEPRPTRSPAWLLVPLLILAWIMLIVATAAHVNRLTEGEAKPAYFDLFFTNTIHMKAWLASGVAVFALFQIFSAAWIFRKLPWPRPRWINSTHRWSGRIAFALSLPVAYHCIFLLGFQETTARTLAHSLLGCFFYGAFAAKVTIVRLHNFPRWVLPAMGGLVFAGLIALWYTSSLWFFTTVDFGR